MSRHQSHLVPSQFSCPVRWFPDRDWVRREWKGRKSLNLCIIWLKVPANVKKLKKIGTEISFLGAFVALSKLFFTILSCELSFVLSRIPSRFFEPSLDLSCPAKNLSQHNTTQKVSQVNPTLYHFPTPVYFHWHVISSLRLTCEFTCDWVQLSRRKESQGLAKILQTSSHYQINQCCNIIQKSCSWGELELWRGLDDLVLK